MRDSILVTAVFCLLAMASIAQNSAINLVPVKPTSWASGKQMFHEYCASCHGEKATGDGSAAPACRARPTDLTTLANRNGGKFSYDRFYAVMRFGVLLPTPAHGSADMPVWLPVLSSLNQDREAIAEQRIYNLARYVASLQQGVSTK